MKAFSLPSKGACARLGGSSGAFKGRGAAQRFPGASAPAIASCLGRRGAQDAVVEADLVIEPQPLSSSNSSNATAVPPISGRGLPPVVMCLAPAEPSPGGSGGSGSSVYLADPPSTSSAASATSGYGAMAEVGVTPPVPTPPVPPPATATPPAPDLAAVAAAASMGAQVDSRGYMREVMNLSVEMVDSVEEDSKTKELDPNSYTTGAAAASVPIAPPAEVSKVRFEARELLRNFDAAEHVGDRHGWMIIMAPETPVAGEECIVMFNRQQSDALRVRPRIQLSYAFNQWQLNDKGNNWVTEMAPAPLPKDQSDFWWARIQIPKDAFELNFVFTDAEGTYENNLGQDFMFPVAEGITIERWMEILAAEARQREMERLEAERKKAEEERRLFAIKMEEERRAREEAERQRQEELRKQDAAKGLRRAEDLGRAYYDLQRKGLPLLRQGDNQFDERAAYVWLVDPLEAKAGSRATLFYNRRASPLQWLQVADNTKLNLRWGVNGWQSAKTLELQRCTEAPALAKKQQEQFGVSHEAEWWSAELDLPFEAVCVDFVVNYFEHYDNNNSKDYALKVALPQGLTLESWTARLAEVFRVQEFEARVAAEEKERQRELRRQERRKKAHDMVLAVERRKVRHVLYTEPEVIKAGEEVTIWYNPQDTPLRGKPQIMLTCGFNRWTHGSPLGPLPMLPPDQPATYDELGNVVTPALARSGSPTHWKATFVVPHDAFKMDFVFSDGQGTYDNRGGYDYHLPVDGSPVKEPSLYVVHIAVEMAPIAKVGGLGDVVTALGRAVQEQGHLVEVCVPKYEFFNYSPLLNGHMRFETEFEWGGTRIVVTTCLVENLRVWFIEPRNGFFNTQTVYGRNDDEVRFDFFCKAALEFLLRTYRQPDILHCHDWSTANVAKSYWCDYHPYGLWKPKVVFTIHNLNYGQKKLAEAAFYCQKFTTVSPTYAFETGGNPIIYPHVHKFWGIRNGIDNDLWDPENNRFLPAPITPDEVAKGKQAARIELRKRLNLSGWGDKFIVAVVSRLTAQKGVHLIKHTAFRTLERGGQFVLLGSAPDPKVQAEFNGLAASMGGQDASFCFKYDEPLSHLIYAAADMIVVPSMFEPCGLTQMIAMRYGAVPIVRHTGGLKDTVFDVDFDKARAAWEIYGSSDWQRDGLDATNGFAFEGTDPMALDYALNRAIDAWYNDRAWFHSLQRRVMEQDWTWNRPGLDYIELYFSAIKNS